jgi:hypothetical protein
MNVRPDRVVAAAIALAGLVIAGCGGDTESSKRSDVTSAARPVTALPADLFAARASAGARNVEDIKKDATATGEVVVRGRIGGRASPFVEGMAVFILADASMKSCDELHGDTCKTPWDYCCEPRDSVAARTATIQVVDAAGKPLRVDLEGKHGMDPLAVLTIVGDVAIRDEGGALVINARKIHVAQPKE